MIYFWSCWPILILFTLRHIYESNAQLPSTNAQLPCTSFPPENECKICYGCSVTDAPNSWSYACLDSYGYYCPPPAGILYSDEDYKQWVGQQMIELYNLTDGTHLEKLESPNFFIGGPQSWSTTDGSSQCNCYNMPITWAAQHLPLDNEQSLAFIRFIIP